MRIYCILVTQIFLLLVDKCAANGTEKCEEVANNLRIVKSCPKSKDEWERAAHDMKCNELAERGNCTNTKKELQYHCVINVYINETLEVCAQSRFIFGFCAEFNVAGRVIQSNYDARCNDEFPKCDDIYRSENAYRFPDCYELVYKNRALKAAEHPQVGNTSDETKHCKETRETPFVVYSVCLVLCGICTMWMLLFSKKMKEKRETHNSTSEEETLHCLMGPLEIGAESKPSIEYFYLKTKDLTYFQYACNQIDYSQWMKTDKHTITMHMDIIIKIGVVGKFTNHNLKFLPEDKRHMPRGACEHILEAVPLLFFQNNLPLHSALEALQKENACHKILVQSEESVYIAPYHVDDSMIIIPQNKEKIIRAITYCLIHLMLHKWISE